MPCVATVVRIKEKIQERAKELQEASETQRAEMKRQEEERKRAKEEQKRKETARKKKALLTALVAMGLDVSTKSLGDEKTLIIAKEGHSNG